MALLQQSALSHPVDRKPKPCPHTEKERDLQKDKEISDTAEDHVLKDMSDSPKKRKILLKAVVNMNHDSGFPPPRIASDARGNATKALLENLDSS